MGVLIKVLSPIWIISLIILVASLVIYCANVTECKELIVPTYEDAMLNFEKFEFTDIESRYSLESIASYKIKNARIQNQFVNKIAVANMTDLVVYLIATTNIINDGNGDWLIIYNHPKYVSIMNDYNASAALFKNGSRSIANDLLKSKDDLNQATALKNVSKDDLNEATDLQIYVRLLPSIQKFRPLVWALK